MSDDHGFTEDQLGQALIAADHAGDEQGARMLTNAIIQMRAARPAPSGGDVSAAAPQRTLDDVANAAGPGTIARTSLAPDDSVKIKRYAESFGQPVTDFHLDPVGNILRKVPSQDGLYARVEPSVRGATGPIDAAERAFDWVSSGVGNAIPAVASGVGAGLAGLVGLPSGPGALAAAAAGGAAGGMAGETARQGLDKALAPPGDNTPMDVRNIGWQGVAGAAGAPIAVLASRIPAVIAAAAAEELPVGAVAERAVLQGDLPVSASSFGVSPRIIDAMRQHIAGKEQELIQLRQDAQDLNVNLSLAQMTGSLPMQQAERQLLRQPETAQSVVDLRSAQNTEQIPAAVRSVMDMIAPDAPAGQQVATFRQGGEDVIGNALDARATQAKIAYAKALDDPTGEWGDADNPMIPHPLPQWPDGVQTLMNRPSMQDAWTAAKRLAAEDGRPLPQLMDFDPKTGQMIPTSKTGPDWRAWDYIKQGLDATIESHTNDFGRVDSIGRAVSITRGKLLNMLDSYNPDYADARALYGSASDATQMILDGGVGFLNKMSGPDRQNMVTNVFNGRNLMPDDIATMRQQFASAGKTDEWNAGVRSYFADKLADALQPLVGSGEPSNVGGKLFSSLFEDRQNEIIKAALGDNTAALARWNKLGNVMHAASRQLFEGSPTATDMGTPGLIQNAYQGVKAVMNPMTELPATLVRGLTSMQKAANAQKFANYALTPEGDKLLRAMYLQTPSSPRAQSILSKMMIQSGAVGTEDEAG